jgi:hypothetical protein
VILHDVINIHLKVTPYLVIEAKLHTPLVCSPCIFQSEWHFYIAKTTKKCDECGGGLVHLSEGYLVATRVGIKETQGLTSDREIYVLINIGKGKQIFRTCLVPTHVVNAHPLFPILFRYNNWICYPVRVLDFFDEANG